MIQEEMTPEQITESENKARRMLVEAVAIAALVEAGATQPTRVLPLMMRGIEAVHVGDGEVRVYAVDREGRVRTGPRGPMGAEELAQEIGQDEAFREIGWNRRHTPKPGATTGRSFGTWQ